MNDWTQITRIDTQPSYLERICWPYDKYPELPQMMAGTEVTLIDADGPGVITNIHSSNISILDGVTDTKSAANPDDVLRLQIEITYDNHETPDISMPFYAFLGDANGRCDFFSTLYISKVKHAHNFRLPIPFERHIKIVIKNPTETDFIGYHEAQWKRLEELPQDCGYLKVAYKKSQADIPEEVAELANISDTGTVKAQWLCIGSSYENARNGEYICEGNQEFYVDGEETPSLEYLGTEDVYGHSWGLSSASSDGFSALTGICHPTEEYTEVNMLRCRTEDSIGFKNSLRVLLDYSQDYFARESVNPFHKQGCFAERERTTLTLTYQSCLYYYGKR